MNIINLIRFATILLGGLNLYLGLKYGRPSNMSIGVVVITCVIWGSISDIQREK